MRDQGQHEESLLQMSEGIALIENLVSRHPDQSEYRIKLANLKGQTSTSLRDLGLTDQAEKNRLELLELLRTIISEDETLWDSVADFVVMANQIAIARFGKRNLPGMRAILSEALPHANRLCIVSPTEPRYLQLEQSIQEKLGICLDSMGETEAAQEQFEASLESARKLHEIDKESVGFKQDFASSAMNLASFYGRKQIETVQAEALTLEALQSWRELNEARPQQRQLANGNGRLLDQFE